jgi:hypothetical protein
MPDVSLFGCLSALITYIIFATLPLGFIWFIHYLSNTYRKRVLSSQLNNFCEGWLDIPQTLDQRKPASWPKVQTNILNHPISISMRRRGGKNKVTYSFFELEVSNPEGLEFYLRKENLLSNIGQMVGIQDVEVGDAKFDNEFIVKTTDKLRLQNILNEELRNSLVERQAASKGFSLKLEKNKIIYETIGEFESNIFNDEFHKMIILAARIADRLEGGSGQLPEPLRFEPASAPPVISPELLSPRRSHVAESIAKNWPDDAEYLKRLSSNLFGGTFTEDKITRYSGRFKDRSLILEYSHETEPKTLKIKMSVIQKFWLRMIPQSGEDNTNEIKVRDPWLDRQFRIHTDRADSAVRFLDSPEVIKEFRTFHFLDRFEIHKGVAVYTLHNPRKNGFLHSALEQTLTRLDRILKIYEEQKLNLLVSALATDSNTCPYCREDFDPAVERIVICNYCRTSHHESCLNENQQCTTWGCLATQEDFSLRSNGESPETGEQVESN